MKRVSCIAFSLILAVSLLTFGVKPGYRGIVYWGASADDVNQRLVAAKVINAAVTPESVEAYRNYYNDPQFVIYNVQTQDWMHFSFTTDLENLFKRDLSISYLTEFDKPSFTQMVVKKDNLPHGGAWVYRFVFYSNELCMASVRYESDMLSNQISQRTPSAPNAHPGYAMAEVIFDKNFKGLFNRHGGYQYKHTRTIDRYASAYYGGYRANHVNPMLEYNESVYAPTTMMSTYYIEYKNVLANITVTYADYSFIAEKALEFQRKEYYLPTQPGEEIIDF